MKSRAKKNAEQAVKAMNDIEKYIREDQREAVMELIRIGLVGAYYKGWTDSEKYFDEKSV